MRTTLLVCLAASVAMIQVNLLLPLAGRTPDSFVMNDLMRLPLGILTGVGFIGGGAILRRDDIVVGVTTAATLWLATVVGLCLGGGQLGLGVVATVLGVFALWGLKLFERRLRQERNGTLALDLEPDGPSEEEIRRRIGEAGHAVVSTNVSLVAAGARRTLSFTLRYPTVADEARVPPLISALAREPESPSSIGADRYSQSRRHAERLIKHNARECFAKASCHAMSRTPVLATRCFRFPTLQDCRSRSRECAVAWNQAQR
jgi:putative Mg2+ transporter-C (MgtC) family protein